MNIICLDNMPVDWPLALNNINNPKDRRIKSAKKRGKSLNK
jgi:hypothetical protein